MTTKIRVAWIIEASFSPRTYSLPKNDKALKQSLKAIGDVRKPILVIERRDSEYRSPTNPNGTYYKVVVGKRRAEAARAAGLEFVSASIESLTDDEAEYKALHDNLLREDLSPIDFALQAVRCLEMRAGISREALRELLLRMYNGQRNGQLAAMADGSEGGPQLAGKVRAIDEFFNELGKNWASFVRNDLPLIAMPRPVTNLLRTHTIRRSHAVSIMKLGTNSAINELCERLERGELKRSEIALFVAERVGNPKRRLHQVRTITDRFERVLTIREQLDGDERILFDETFAQIEERLNYLSRFAKRQKRTPENASDQTIPLIRQRRIKNEANNAALN